MAHLPKRAVVEVCKLRGDFRLIIFLNEFEVCHSPQKQLSKLSHNALRYQYIVFESGKDKVQKKEGIERQLAKRRSVLNLYSKNSVSGLLCKEK